MDGNCPACGRRCGDTCYQPSTPMDSLTMAEILDEKDVEIGRLKCLLKEAITLKEKAVESVAAQMVRKLQFPTMLRKMWSGNEVQEWLSEQADKMDGGPEDESNQKR